MIAFFPFNTVTYLLSFHDFFIMAKAYKFYFFYNHIICLRNDLIIYYTITPLHFTTIKKPLP